MSGLVGETEDRESRGMYAEPLKMNLVVKKPVFEITVSFWLSLPVHSGSLKRIDYPKHICLAHPLSFECFHCS